MRRLPPLLVLGSLLLPACVVAKIGSGDPATLEADFEGVDALSLTTFVDTTVTVTPGVNLAHLSLTCDDSLLEDFSYEVTNGVLEIGDEVDYALVPQTECHAEVDLPALRTVSTEGSGRIEVVSAVEGLELIDSSGSGGLVLGTVSTCDLSISHSGSGPVTVDGLAACAVDATVSGSGRTSLVGAAESADVRVTGSGGFGEADFVVDDLTLVVSGSGGAELTALESVDITVTGSGGVVIHGDPADRDVETTGSGGVSFE